VKSAEPCLCVCNVTKLVNPQEIAYCLQTLKLFVPWLLRLVHGHVSKAYVATIEFLLYSVINNKILWTNVVAYVMLFTERQQDAVLAIVNPSVCLSVTRWCLMTCIKMTQTTIMRSSLENSPMTLVSSNTVGLQTVFNTILLQHIVFFIKNIFLWSISSEAGRILL